MKLVDARKTNSIFLLLNDEEIKSLQEGGYPTFDLNDTFKKLPKNVRYLSLMRESASSLSNPNESNKRGKREQLRIRKDQDEKADESFP